ncbi:DUF4956 domain-containing protein [Prochlorococcus marinus]|uniref:DUF4956 domain-containing protein n=1 Tax=Prochlorococcus marinus (strain MIT 9211) TaxID=93059 RepID=A9BA35_PROM4|nr:DUF4956 domain-containing protein [Prochlorococcus marinus]ABX08697.1 Hypothetical protein P9211_07661 [Prochlorococcus marinus str. MIT 9211]
MNKDLPFQEFLANSPQQQSIEIFAINILIAFILSSLLGYIYTKYGNSLSNRRSFAQNFNMISMTTMLIISIVKSSLALSLGLVGALSIVRFRTALKEPEELAFTFLCIAIGLGLGANQRLISIVGFLIITGLYIVKSKAIKSRDQQSVNLIITSQEPSSTDSEQIIDLLRTNSDSLDLKRLTEDNSILEIALCIEIDNYKKLIYIKDKLRLKFPSLSINFIENGTLYEN